MIYNLFNSSIILNYLLFLLLVGKLPYLIIQINSVSKILLNFLRVLNWVFYLLNLKLNIPTEQDKQSRNSCRNLLKLTEDNNLK